MTFQEKMESNKANREHNKPATMAMFNITHKEEVKLLPPALLHPFAEHTFEVNEDSMDFLSLMESIKLHGILSPVLVRPSKNVGLYEIISGHRRHRVATVLNMVSIPCVIQPHDDDTATQLMGILNIQRPNWLPSEKARTYKAHLEATKRLTGITKGTRTDLTSATKLPRLDDDGQVSQTPETQSPNSRNRDESGKVWGISGEALRTYIKLNDLIPDLMKFTDIGRIVVKGGYQLSFLSPTQQEVIATVLRRYEKKKLSASKCQELREADKAGELDETYVLRLLGINGGAFKRADELPINIRFTSSSLLCSTSVKKALNDPAVLEDIENILITYAKKHDLPLT